MKWPAVLARVDVAVDWAASRELGLVIDVHHHDELCGDPDRHAHGFLALWARIAERHATASPRLCFELLNEPHDPMTAERWNALLTDALAVVRASNPERTVLVGPVRWNTVGALPDLRLPADEHLVVTVHYYSPFALTHQGAEWIEGADRWLGRSWGTEDERRRIRTDLAHAAGWARAGGRPLFLGEFGVHADAGVAARAAWTTAVRSEAERLGIGWAYWDFATGFGAFDLERDAWRPALAEALFGGR